MPLRDDRRKRGPQRGCSLVTAVLWRGIIASGKKQESRSLTRVNSIGDSPPGPSLIPESELLPGALVRKTLRGKGFVSILWLYFAGVVASAHAKPEVNESNEYQVSCCGTFT